jgi:dihydroneopterin aldolase
MDRIELSGIHLHACRIGVTAAERSRPQEIIVDVSLGTDVRRAAASDDVADAIDYAAVHATVAGVAMGREFALIEALAQAIASAVLNGFPVAEVRVRVTKPGALRDQGVACAAVEITRAREG